jgi:FKBP-type peptidyl-prolyl cis-trans isomerase FklB
MGGVLVIILALLAGCDRDSPASAGNAATAPDPVAGTAAQPTATTADPVPETVAQPTTDSSGALDGDVAKASYSMGYKMAENIEANFAGSIDSEAFLRGVGDRFSRVDSAVSAEEATAALTALAERKTAARATRAEGNLEEGRLFLEKNATRKGVVSLPSGLQYEVLTAAKGPHPSATDTVTTHYHGTLVDGTVFDSSYERGEPASFPLNRVIKGWTEGLQLMAVGAKWRFYVPPELGYGDEDRSPIPANSTLIFDVELLKIGSG